MMRIMLIEDDPMTARALESLLTHLGVGWHVRCAGSLAAVHEARAQSFVDVALLDLNLPDACGLETIRGVRQLLPEAAIVVVTGESDESLPLRAIRAGAQDYLVKGQVTKGLLKRSVELARERFLQQKALEKAAFADELTGLFNRRGFMEMGKDLIAQAVEFGSPCTVLFGDLDGLKEINDTAGHAAGDWAIRMAGQALRAAWPARGIVARFGGDEFVGLYTDADDDFELHVRASIREMIDGFNAEKSAPTKLAISLGFLTTLPASQSLESILENADAELLKEKLRSRARRGIPA